ncbi:MAG TPA: hypothetical protein VH165_15660 [Kofleriaceae bacterium]|jgi:hypothetical protein|nr:hypothetical protein [Kofleriaceae bacterium]
MRIVDHQPSSWFLAEEDGALFLDVNCSQGPSGFSLLTRLTDDERVRIVREGRSATDAIARHLEHHATTLFAERDLGPDWQARLSAAVTDWQAAKRST